MYTDILMNGTKRFVVVTSHPTEKGRFAQTGVLFELEDLKEVSEQTGDKIKYICNHKVTGRVRIHRILNPEAWESRDTYLKVEGTIDDDSGKDAKPMDEVYGAVFAAAKAAPAEEKQLKSSFAKLVDLQHELEEDVRFTKGAIDTLAVKDGPGDDGLWQTVRLWQSFVDQRLMARQNELQQDFQEKLKEFLQQEKGVSEDELPSAIGFQELSPTLQAELQNLQKLMRNELQPLVLESSLTMQKILEAPDHRARCLLLTFFVESETRRLGTKKRVANIFSGLNAAMEDDSSVPEEERIATAESLESSMPTKEDKGNTKSIYLDEPDSFQ
uniref:Lon N-terminal domain-containing protein n=2 Tax=Craspedostauros australis TaxID=1486917 RepID=A0A7R9ZIQ4_9STRA|mmetsp:Transcript_13018/g.35919  ORF Transcript_13018/g.35919 Transcript_13018/m.35919 type:complete len:328 (+) Transcript_13018:225-1208(+)